MDPYLNPEPPKPKLPSRHCRYGHHLSPTPPPPRSPSLSTTTVIASSHHLLCPPPFFLLPPLLISSFSCCRTIQPMTNDGSTFAPKATHAQTAITPQPIWPPSLTNSPLSTSPSCNRRFAPYPTILITNHEIFCLNFWDFMCLIWEIMKFYNGSL